MSFDPHFRFYSEDPQDRNFWMVEFADLEAEVRAELASRCEFYPRLVTKGRMTRDALEREIRVMAAIAWVFTFPFEKREAVRPASTWAERVHVVRREIALRRTLYPNAIASGRLAEADAVRKLGLMETLHDYIWNEVGSEAVAGRAATLDAGKRRAAA